MKLTQKQEIIIEKLNYNDPQDFLKHYPIRYDFLSVKPVQEWQEKDTVVIHGPLIGDFKRFSFGRNRAGIQFMVEFEQQLIRCTFFARLFVKKEQYIDGITVIGTVSKGGLIVKSLNQKPLVESLGIKPIYGLKSGIKNHEVHNLMKKILKKETFINNLPVSLIQKYRLQDRDIAIREIHFPQSSNRLRDALRTLKYEEFLAYHLSLMLQSTHQDKGFAKQGKDIDDLIETLPFKLIADQELSIREIITDLKSQKKMQRMLQGDVGSGKTIVAFLAAIYVMRSNYQVAMMAPTELLARQHFDSFKRFFPDIPVYLLTQDVKDKQLVLERLKLSQTLFVIGTHALFQDSVEFNNLSFVIIDEQHRFGVEQRQRLIQKGDQVDSLMLSATPIPRSLARALFFDQEVSSITQYPEHRKETKTVLINENSIRSIVGILTEQLQKKEQIYIVCPSIFEDERPHIKNVYALEEQLTNVFEDFTVGVLHGQMSAEEKSLVMGKFIKNEIHVLICTTIIEVGVDVHNANTMVVYNAEQFGLSTLHQLRGRVGRGKEAGQCFYLSKSEHERLEALLESSDGFELSLKDMRFRGFGDVLGKRQTGMPQFILADVIEDEKILNVSKYDAIEITNDKENIEYRSIIEYAKSMNDV